VWLLFFLSFAITDALVGVYIGFPGIFAFFVLTEMVTEIFAKGW